MLGCSGALRFADQADHLSPADLQGHVREQGPGGAGQQHGQVLDVEQHGGLPPDAEPVGGPDADHVEGHHDGSDGGARHERGEQGTLDDRGLSLLHHGPQSELGGWAPKPR